MKAKLLYVIQTAALACGVLLGQNVLQAGPVETQTFDDESSASAAGWIEQDSRVNGQNYGFSNSNNAEGGSAGEAGGTFARHTGSGYYADVTLDDGRNVIPAGDSSAGMSNHNLWASGRLKFDNGANLGEDSTELAFGWFEEGKINLQDPFDLWIGFNATPQDNGTVLAKASLAGLLGGRNVVLTEGVAYDFTVSWDLDGGAGGKGQIAASFTPAAGGPTFLTTLDSDPIDWDLDAFGVINRSRDDSNATYDVDFFFDDLSYRADYVPEPVALVLAGLGLSALAVGRPRRRTIRR